MSDWMDQQMKKALGVKSYGEAAGGSLAVAMFQYTFSKMQENLRIARETEARRRLLELKKKEGADRERMIKTYFRDRSSDSLVSQYTYCVVLAQYIAAIGNTRVGLAKAITKDLSEKLRWAPLMELNQTYSARANKIKAIVARPNEDVKREIQDKMRANLNLTHSLFSKASFPDLWRSAAKHNQQLAWLADVNKPVDDGYLEMRHALIEGLAPCLHRASALDTVFKLEAARDDVKASLLVTMGASTGMAAGKSVAEEMIRTVRGAVWAARRVT